MKKSTTLSIIASIIIGCNTRNFDSNHHADSIDFDTIVVNQYDEHQQFLLQDSMYSKLNSSEIIDLIRGDICEYRGIHNLRDMEFPFSHPRGKKYKSSNIPPSVYTRIFGNRESHINVKYHTNIKVDSVKEKVYIERGIQIRDNRKYKYLLSMHEKDDYIQFLFTANGKYTPQIFLITANKSSLKLIDELNVFKSFADVNEFDLIYTNFYDDFNKLSITEIKNNGMDYNKIDTIHTHFTISKFGKIAKI